MKVELNDARSGKICKSPISSRLVCLDGTWWVIDVNDPDLEAHLKRSAHCPDGVTRSTDTICPLLGLAANVPGLMTDNAKIDEVDGVRAIR